MTPLTVNCPTATGFASLLQQLGGSNKVPAVNEQSMRVLELSLDEPIHVRSVVFLHTGEQLRKGVHLVESDTNLPPFFDTFDDYREFCLEYRSSLGKIARLTACLLPEPALAAASRRLSSALGLCSVSGTSIEASVNSRFGNPHMLELECIGIRRGIA